MCLACAPHMCPPRAEHCPCDYHHQVSGVTRGRQTAGSSGGPTHVTHIHSGAHVGMVTTAPPHTHMSNSPLQMHQIALGIPKVPLVSNHYLMLALTTSQVLRKKLAPLQLDTARVHALTALMMCKGDYSASDRFRMGTLDVCGCSVGHGHPWSHASGPALLVPPWPQLLQPALCRPCGVECESWVDWDGGAGKARYVPCLRPCLCTMHASICSLRHCVPPVSPDPRRAWNNQ